MIRTSTYDDMGGAIANVRVDSEILLLKFVKRSAGTGKPHWSGCPGKNCLRELGSSQWEKLPSSKS